MYTSGELVNSDFSAPHPAPHLVDTAKTRKEFGQRVLRARLEFGARLRTPRQVSQTEIAEAMGVSKATVSNWEHGLKEPADLGTITKLAFVLGVRPAWLAFGEEPMRGTENGDPGPTRKSARAG